MKVQSVRGTHDLYGYELAKYRHVENLVRNIAHIYNFNEIITPIFEFTEFI